MKKIHNDKDIKCFQKAIDTYFKEYDFNVDKEYTKMIKQDIIDLESAVELIKKCKYKEAQKFIWSLDTIVREQVPNKIWRILDSII